MRNNVPVDDIGQRPTAPLAAVLLQCRHVGRCLPWMVQSAQRVHPGNAGPIRLLLNDLLSKCARHDGIRLTSQSARNFIQRLAVAYTTYLHDTIPSELFERDFERHPPPQPWLFEQQAQLASLHGAGITLA